MCAAFFDRPGYPAPRCTFRPAFTDRAKQLGEQLLKAGTAPQELPIDMAKEAYQRGKLAAADGHVAEAEAHFAKARDLLKTMTKDGEHPSHRDAASLLRLLEAE